MFHSSHGQHSIQFTVPAGSGSYAAEIMYLTSGDPETLPTGVGQFDVVSELTGVVSDLETASTLEVDILKPGGDPATAADWILAVAEWTAAGLQTLVALSGWPGVRIRCKSGGTLGTTDLSVCWW